jgi:hypothetical protein
VTAFRQLRESYWYDTCSQKQGHEHTAICKGAGSALWEISTAAPGCCCSYLCPGLPARQEGSPVVVQSSGTGECSPKLAFDLQYRHAVGM